MNFLKLTKEQLKVEEINDLVADESCGAISMFIGTTRDNFENKKVLTLEYEAYDSMAIKEMTKICNNLRTKWPDIKKIAIYHRLGIVPVKEASVVIAISSPHRQTSLDSVALAIDELKRTVPIWKKEQYSDNGETWKENKESTSGPKRLKLGKLSELKVACDTSDVPKNFIQISADEKEILRRIHCFVEKKREEIDHNNILDFTTNQKPPSEDSPANDSCARINAIVHKQKDSKGHLRIHRVKNDFGPQTRPEYVLQLDKLMKKEPSTSSSSTSVTIKQEPSERHYQPDLPVGVKERLENVETYLNVGNNNLKSIYERLKKVEDKISYLETVSPDYKHFLNSKTETYNRQKVKAPQKKNYSIAEIDELINSVKSEFDENKAK